MKKNYGKHHAPLLKRTKRIMKIASLCNLLAVCSISAASYAQELTYSINKQNSTMIEVFKEIEKNTDYTFFYNDNKIDVNREVSVSASNAHIEEILSEVLENTNYSYKIIDKQILIQQSEGKLASVSGVNQNKKKITGKVLDSTGMPIIGANVIEKGTSSNGTITDIDGNFSLEVDANSIIVVSYIGYSNQEVKVGNKSNFSIALKEDTKTLDEVVVVGYGTQKKVNLTGAVASFRPEDIAEVQTNSVSSMIKGQLSGVQITQNNGKPGASSTIRIRGVGTLGADEKNNPLLVVDGQAVDYGIETIDPNDIESVSVLKDASSAAIYGSRAANGVILLTTKRGNNGVGKLSFNAYASVQTMMKKIDLLNAEDYVMLQNEAYKNAGMESAFAHEPSYYGKGTDWIDELTQLSTIQEYNISFSKGNEQSNYYISGTYYTQNGIVKNTGYDRASLRFNGDAKILPKLKVGNSITLTWNESSGSSEPLGQAVVTPPTVPVKNDDGSWGYPSEKGEGGINPMYLSELYSGSKQTMWRALANIYAEYQILKELKFKVTGAIDFAAQNDRSYYPKVTVPGEYTDFSDQKLNDNMSIGYTSRL